MTEPFPWQRSLWQRLWQRRRDGRLPHALLFCGPAGVGKRNLAQSFAQTLLCEAGGERACGRCKGCHLWQAGAHPDYLAVGPKEAGKPIVIDQVRELCAFLGFTRQRAAHKVALLAPAEAMNTHAANSLLKTL